MAWTLQQLLVHQDWSDIFTPRTLARGIKYANQGRVTQVKLSPDSDNEWTILEGVIRGSGQNVYECSAYISHAFDEIGIDTDCSCPVGLDCKHAVAMLHAIAHGLVSGSQKLARLPLTAETPKRGHEDQHLWQRWDNWLSNPYGFKDDGLVAGAERQFGLLVGASLSGEFLRAEPVWMRPSRRKGGQGGMVDPQPVMMDSRYGPVPAPAGGWPDEEASALSHLMNAPFERHKNHDWYIASQEHVGRALEVLLERHPAYFERGSKPLKRGPDIEPKLEWIEHEDGRQTLTLAQADHAHRLILRAGNLWYIDRDSDCYGRINGDPDILMQIRHMPELPPEYVKEARKKLRKSPLASTVPLPTPRQRGQDIKTRPTAVLRVATKVLSDFFQGDLLQVGYARLYFDYGGGVIESADSAPVTKRIIDGKIHAIHTNEQAEDQNTETLIAHGLVPLAALNEYRWADEEDPEPWRCWLLAPDDYTPPLAPDDWAEALSALSEKGFRIEYSQDFPRARKVDIEDWHAELTPSETGHAWFDVALGIDVNGERIDMLPLLRHLIADPNFPRRREKGEKKNATWAVWLDEERHVDMPLKRLRAMIEPLLEWLESDNQDSPRVHGTELEALDETGIHWHGGEALRKHIKNLTQARKAKPPRALRTTLRPYQNDGLAWLNFLSDAGLGGILADDMGLGKTVQVLAHILSEKQRRRLKHPALVIAPTSLVGNWADEAARFTPTLKTLVLHGNQRHDDFERIDTHNLVITTYPLLPRDKTELAEHKWSIMVLDEAQAIKNARSQTARAVRSIAADRHIAMTGTPLENHLGELWAQFDAVEPGLLGGNKHFRRHYRTPIEKHGDAERQQQLNRRIGALLLRRRKDDVLKELPVKNDIVRHIELNGAQRQLYETLRLAQHQRVRDAVAERGLARSGIIVLDALLKLRQACCDPRLVKLDSARRVKQSAKLDALLELLDGLVAEGRRVLVFSQFTSMLALIIEALNKRDIAHQTLTGQTPGKQRSQLVKRFQDGKVPVFLISLKAGGVGLNLTAADTVIHYDPWWNPAVENQATDRAHRIGQDKPVFVYRLISTDTVEEKIRAMQTKKAELAKAVLEGGSSKKLRFNEQDLDALFGKNIH